MEKVLNFLKKEIRLNENDVIVVGVSTGPDSMALLDILLKLQKELKYKIVVAHVNHNMRKESYEEYDFLKEYCEQKNIVFEGMVIEKYGDDNFHNEARNIRYNFYHKLIDKYNANYLMTGHHGDDLIETILMRIVRGSTLHGYGGFEQVVNYKNYKLIRPLLYVTKEELENYDIQNNVKYYIDKSNYKDVYTRNRYRKNVLPFLKEEEKNVHEKFIKFSKNIYECDQFIENITNTVFNDVYSDGIIKQEEFIKLDTVIQKRIIDKILFILYHDDLIEIDDRHVDLILETIKSKKASLKYNLPNDYLIIKEYNKIYFKKNIDELIAYDLELNDELILANGMKLIKLEECDTDGNDVLRINTSDVVMPLRVRTRKNGDRITLKTLNKSKKVSEVFINSKIPLSKRDLWPIVVDSSDKVIWIPGVKKSKYNRLKNEKCDIIYKCC